ncbi:peptide/nickel transport system ATP-binding protein/oligopeptide transport system ATP-binding protein [Pseudonocardia thermophila]|jgi:oligopeptide/dipeptide ABC transporter, ATP-binding protein, C-terminal domain|uniref:Peptide/nickel transport system ATP-binding protein/oligopeptide transport system ATP-binding protein n=1 Tax=Pseudonocardia thermophila TaxID=1848 RepID=A0A1M6ZX92_PSETH|nr:oligopeptide/dipeptide ABC transporter ATP-binding protein [Pseudonocardia thermophila]SHL34943.1 peptide/nickel transport system ATP-binding protein/oligopeptide transport system ATP-binding protein [Pseudonocardia thermophila]
MSIMELRDVNHVFRRGGKEVHAVNGVSLSVAKGETVAVIGESGSGKSTLGRIALGLITPTSGSVVFDGIELTALSRKQMRPLRSRLQVVFQEPYESLNPRLKVGDIIAEPLIIHRPELSRAERREKVVAMLERVGLTAEHADRLPRNLSGGQQQRIGIARAIITEPELVILDEPTSSLDVSVRARVLDLLRDLQRERGISYVFISHDLATVGLISDRVAVMYLGTVVEQGPTQEVLTNPRHPYTQALMSATLSTVVGQKREHVPLRGEIPNPSKKPTKCVLSGRCPIEVDACSSWQVRLAQVADRHEVACMRVEQEQKQPVELGGGR